MSKCPLSGLLHQPQQKPKPTSSESHMCLCTGLSGRHATKVLQAHDQRAASIDALVVAAHQLLLSWRTCQTEQRTHISAHPLPLSSHAIIIGPTLLRRHAEDAFQKVQQHSCSHSEHQVIASQGHQGGGGVVGHAGHPTPHPNLPLQFLPLEVPDAQLPVQACADQHLVAGVCCNPGHAAVMSRCPLLAWSCPVSVQINILETG